MRILLVDDEVQVLKGVSRIISCEEEDWEVETALSGEEALEILEHEKFNVVISDMRMPGMDGAQLLDEIRRRYPSMLRVVLSGRADRETALRAVKPMHQYLSKPCDSEELFDVIKRAAIFQETIKSAEILDAIGRANCLPSFPKIINEINREIDSHDCSSKSIAKIVSKDPVVSSKLLQLANSAIFGSRSPIADIDRAISLTGFDIVRSIVISQAIYSGNENKNRKLSAKSLLDHGYRVAVIGKNLARHVGASAEDSNAVFSAGLLHDFGKLILLNTFPDKYAAILKSANLVGQSIQQLEMTTFGASHDGIGGYLFGLWGLPPDVTESVASHHSFLACAKAVGLPHQLVFAANWIARNRCAAELQDLVEAAGSVDEAKAFAAKITQWKAFIVKTESEDK